MLNEVYDFFADSVRTAPTDRAYFRIDGRLSYFRPLIGGHLFDANHFLSDEEHLNPPLIFDR